MARLPTWAALLLAGIVVLVLNSAVIGVGLVGALGVILACAGIVVLIADLIGAR